MGRPVNGVYDFACALFIHRWGLDPAHCRVTLDGNRASPIYSCPTHCPRRAFVLKHKSQLNAYHVRRRALLEPDQWDDCT